MLGSTNKWLLPTEKPSLADISFYYQLKWGTDIAKGKGVYNLTGGNVGEDGEPVTDAVFNSERYPAVYAWFRRFGSYISTLPDLETVIEPGSTKEWKSAIQDLEGEEGLGLIPAAAAPNSALDGKMALVEGTLVSVVPDDTGRGNPTVGRLVQVGVEEVVIKPEVKGELCVVVHFPRVGFVVKRAEDTKL